MRIICDINTSFQNSLICLATIINDNLSKEKTIDEIYWDCKEIYKKMGLITCITYADIYEALLILFCKNMILYVGEGKVVRFK